MPRLGALKRDEAAAVVLVFLTLAACTRDATRSGEAPAAAKPSTTAGVPGSAAAPAATPPAQNAPRPATTVSVEAMKALAEIMSLGGIAIAIGELADAVIVLIENAHVRLAAAPPGDRSSTGHRRGVQGGGQAEGVPGRKNLIWISGAFPALFDQGVGPGSRMTSIYPDLVRATRALSAADVAIYPVDARGLVGHSAADPPTRSVRSRRWARSWGTSIR